MIKFRKKISSIMVVIFTMLSLSSITAGAVTQSTSTKSVTALEAAITAVNSAQIILSTSAYDLAVNPRILLKSNTAVINAINAIYLLSKTTPDYKVLTAKISADLVRMESAKKNIVAVKATEVTASANAEAAIRAFEVAPLITTADLTAAKTLQITAIAALDKVRNSDIAKYFALRLKIVTNKLVAL